MQRGREDLPSMHKAVVQIVLVHPVLQIANPKRTDLIRRRRLWRHGRSRGGRRNLVLHLGRRHRSRGLVLRLGLRHELGDRRRNLGGLLVPHRRRRGGLVVLRLRRHHVPLLRLLLHRRRRHRRRLHHSEIKEDDRSRNLSTEIGRKKGRWRSATIEALEIWDSDKSWP